MARVSIQIPDDLKATLDARAAEAGCTLEGYVESLLRTDAEMIDYGAPSHLSYRSREQLEAFVLEGIDSPARELTAKDWQQMRQDLIKNRKAE